MIDLSTLVPLLSTLRMIQSILQGWQLRCSTFQGNYIEESGFEKVLFAFEVLIFNFFSFISFFQPHLL